MAPRRGYKMVCMVCRNQVVILAKLAAAASIANFANHIVSFSLTWMCKQWQIDHKNDLYRQFCQLNWRQSLTASLPPPPQNAHGSFKLSGEIDEFAEFCEFSPVANPRKLHKMQSL
jgi:hypothetical protein